MKHRIVHQFVSVSLFWLLFVPQSGANQNEEFRATWVITWDHINSSNSPEENMARIREILDDHVSANMTSVLFQVRQSGTAYYNSSFEPWGYYAGYQDPGYDPLEYAIEQAHQRGLELHAWFNVFQTSSMFSDTLSTGDTIGAPAVLHPEWVCRDQDGNPMTAYRSISPGLIEVRNYTVDVAMEIVNNYDIDGLHLDYIRWNEYTSSTARPEYTGGQIEEIRMIDGIFTESQYQAISRNQTGRYLYDYLHPYSAGVPNGFSSWEDWWTSSVTEFVHTLHDSIQDSKPYVRLSVAALGRYNWGVWQGLGDVYQDAAQWFNEGYIEQLSPMHYHWTTGSGFYSMLEGGCPDCWSDYIQDGISGNRLYSVGPGSYILHNNNIWGNHSQIVQSSRNVEWVDGFQFFSSGTWDHYDYWSDATEDLFSGRTKIRNIPASGIASPNPPNLNISKIDSLTYQLQIIPPDTTNNNWFLLYRSEDIAIDTSNDEIINVHFGRDTFSITQSFSGLQDFNGNYTYGVTQCDRKWNESGLSNTTISDSIPSFPPTIISTNPQEGDTIPVQSDLSIFFSKTIDSSTVGTAVSITPETSYQIEILTTNKSLIVSFPLPLGYDTTYTLLIDSTLTDVNGKRLDGNGDGDEGDSYLLQFHTEQEDIYGPLLIQTDVNFDAQSSGIDLDAPLTFVFDEEINPATISSAISWTSGNEEISYDDFLINQGHQSIYSIRSVSSLSQLTDYTLTISNTLTDSLGNSFIADTAYFTSSQNKYTDITLIDPFNSVSNWWNPSGSGSTIGILAGTGFGTSTQVYMPRTSPYKSAKLSYVWDTSASAHLLREYLSGGPPRAVLFDTTVTLQCFVFGDNSDNSFRFCIDEKTNGSWSNHEVSKWINLDWHGWRLVEWDLGDPNSVGPWIGNQQLDGTTYRIDSFQLTYDTANGLAQGAIFFDDLRIVTKSSELEISLNESFMPDQFVLYQNYPNPFNSSTNISFSIPDPERVSLTIYDLLGRKTVMLISKHLQPGHYNFNWNGRDKFGKEVPSGTYFCQLRGKTQSQTTRMVLIK